jgi:hypothetical protein
VIPRALKTPQTEIAALTTARAIMSVTSHDQNRDVIAGSIMTPRSRACRAIEGHQV